MSNRRRPFRLLLMAPFAAFWGAFAFYRVSSKPRFEAIHVLDVIGLMTAGAGFAVALTVLMFFLRGFRSENNRAGGKSGEESN